MPPASDPDPDRTGDIIDAGKDEAGHWLVQDGTLRLQAGFVSDIAAMNHERAKRQIRHAAVEVTTSPLKIAIVPATAQERSRPCAAWGGLRASRLD